mgnify:CR=1 FL=1
MLQRFGVTRIGIPSFIMTLAMLQIGAGICAMLVRGQIAYAVPPFIATLGMLKDTQARDLKAAGLAATVADFCAQLGLELALEDEKLRFYCGDAPVPACVVGMMISMRRWSPKTSPSRSPSVSHTSAR